MLCRLALLLFASTLTACTGLFFHPMEGHVLSPERFGLAHRDVEFTTSDGVTLHGWFLPAAAPAVPRQSCTVLFLHGNAENISTHIAGVAWLPRRGINVFLFDYRGYGRSAGSPSVAGLHRDFEAALDTALALPEVDPERIAVFGQSLGGSIAITGLAASPHRGQVRALIVDSAFSDYQAIAREKAAAFWLTWPLQWPIALTVDSRYKPLEAIAEVSPVPVLIIHGRADRVIPVHHGEALYAAARQPKALWLFDDLAHIQTFRDQANRARLRRYLDRC